MDVKAHFYSPMGLRGDHFVIPFILLPLLHFYWPPLLISDSFLAAVFISDRSMSVRFLVAVLLVSVITADIATASPDNALNRNSSSDPGPPLFHAEFSVPPDESSWQGDLQAFRVEMTTTGWKLRLDAEPESGISYLVTRKIFEPVQWEWHVRQTFTPSNTNRAFFFLNADKPDLDKDINGLALRTGESGSPKHFRLIQFTDGMQKNELLKSDVEIESDKEYFIRIIKSPANEIHLYLADGVGQPPLLQSEVAPAAEFGNKNSGHFGFRAHYTTTRSNQFFLGDITLSDNLPEPGIFELHSYTVADPDMVNKLYTEIQITFNVPPAAFDLVPELFRLGDSTRPVDISCTHPQICTLRFNEVLESGERPFYIEPYQTIYGQQTTLTHKTLYLLDDASPGDIVINEILYRPDNKGNNRFVELINRSDKLIDLRGWEIGRRLGNAITILNMEHPDPVVLPPDSVVVISEPGLVIHGNSTKHLKLNLFPPLSRTGDSVFIRSSDELTIDSLSYQPGWGGNADGVSMERIDPYGATSDSSNWRTHPNQHTAGMLNYHFENNPGLPEVLYAGIKNSNTVKIVFNRFVTTKSIGTVMLDGRPLELTTGNNNLSSKIPVADAEFIFRSDQVINRENKKITLLTFKDVAGREQRDYSVPLAFPPEPGELIINEIMYQPAADRYSQQPDQSEYIEIRNRSEIALHLDGVHLHDQPDKNRRVSKIKSEDLTNAVISPGAYAVFYADTSQSFILSRIYRAFPIPQSTKDSFYRIDRLTLGFSTQGDEVYLSDRTGSILDSLWYQPDWHNQNIIDTRGIGLERIHPEIATMDRNNWTSATTIEGGTPGFENSVSVNNLTVEKFGLQLSPNPFSPNGDGLDDHLIINYYLNHPNYLIHARIFDRHGRLVRTLADGKRAGLSGELIWDGRTSNGIMNRTGLYIIHFEAIDPAGALSRIYKEIAVLAVPL